MKRLGLMMIVLGGFLGCAATANRDQGAPRVPEPTTTAQVTSDHRSQRPRRVGTLPRLCNAVRRLIVGRTTGQPCANGSR
jgi:hypothetical protein